MARRPNYGALLRVLPMIVTVVAILVLKQRCGDSTAKLLDVVTDRTTGAPLPPPKALDLAAPR